MNAGMEDSRGYPAHKRAATDRRSYVYMDQNAAGTQTLC